MMRAWAFEQVEGFNPALIADEEPEMCVRLRQKGWKILRLDAEMTLHDAQMTSFAQWWKRAQTAGHAYAECSWMHGSEPERHWVKETQSAWLWGLVLPALALAMALPTQGWTLLRLSAYPLATYRIYNYYVKHRDITTKDAAIYPLSCVLAKFPHLQGQIPFHQRRLLGAEQANRIQNNQLYKFSKLELQLTSQKFHP